MYFCPIIYHQVTLINDGKTIRNCWTVCFYMIYEQQTESFIIIIKEKWKSDMIEW